MKQIPWLALSIDRWSKVPVFEQICLAVRTRVISGELPEGSKLPPTREFATELGVSRSIVVTAYEQLVAEGYLQSLIGSGYTVCALGEVELPTRNDAPATPKLVETAMQPVPFAAGQPDMRLFPHRQWAKVVSRVCRTKPQSMLMGGSVFGNPDLRNAIAAHISEWRGIEASPHQIFITAGAADALQICLRTLTEKNDEVGLENPGYVRTRHFIEAHGLSPVYLDIDDNGATLPTGKSNPRLVVLTPSHQFPRGGAMPPNRRLEFIAWAKAKGAWIVEDDYDSEFRYAGRPIPAMAGFDRLQRTIYVGSFSKIFSNSLRLGYLVVPEQLLDPFRIALERFGPKASYMPQQALSEFMASGEFYRHLRRVRRIYSVRRKVLIDKLATEFSDYGSFCDHQAGMQVVLHLHQNFDDTEISRKAAELGVQLQPLSSFAANPSEQNGLVLGFCGYSEEEMAPSFEALKSCFS